MVKLYEPKDYEKVMLFLQGVHSLKEIEEELFENAVIIIGDDEILGLITYELFRKRALIRYFIFNKGLSESILLCMYEKFFMNLKENNINKVFVIINNKNLTELFVNLGFKEFPKDDFYLTEECIANTKYKDATVMCYDIT